MRNKHFLGPTPDQALWHSEAQLAPACRPSHPSTELWDLPISGCLQSPREQSFLWVLGPLWGQGSGDGSPDTLLIPPEGGLQELSGHFENQKVMYGFCSVKDSQAALPKYVLINWVCSWGLGEGAEDPRTVTLHPASPTDAAGENPPTPGRGPRPQAADPSCLFLTPSSLGALQVGEDVPDARKCACASHVAKVAEFFQVRGGPGLVGWASHPGQGLCAGSGDRKERAA